MSSYCSCFFLIFECDLGNLSEKDATSSKGELYLKGWISSKLLARLFELGLRFGCLTFALAEGLWRKVRQDIKSSCSDFRSDSERTVVDFWYRWHLMFVFFFFAFYVSLLVWIHAFRVLLPLLVIHFCINIFRCLFTLPLFHHFASGFDGTFSFLIFLDHLLFEPAFICRKILLLPHLFIYIFFFLQVA